jgi:hypothetical protein
MVSQPVETLLALYETHSSIATFTRPQALSKLTLSQINTVHKFPSYFFTTHIIFSLLHRGLPSCFSSFSDSVIQAYSIVIIHEYFLPQPFISLYITHLIVQNVLEFYLLRAFKTIISIRAECLHKLL